MARIKVEVCISCDDVAAMEKSVQNAFTGGADTVELCRDLSSGGLTPETDAVECARKAFRDRKGLMVMIRPHAGNFTYDDQAVSVMCSQIEAAADAGADGVVLGALADSAIDASALARLIRPARDRGLVTTFHRAFDATVNRAEALEILVDHGFDRLLTSGTPWGSDKGALGGVDVLRETVDHAADRMEIVIGGGIGAENAVQVLDRLNRSTSRISVHAYSALLSGGLTDQRRVEELVSVLHNY